MSADALITDGAAKSVTLNLTPVLPLEKLTVICQSIETNLAGNAHPVVYFVSPYDREGAGTIAFETALVAATRLGKRTLVVDMAESADAARQTLARALDAAPAAGDSAPSFAVVKDTTLFYVSLFGKNPGAVFIKDLLDAARPHYDLIVLNGESGLSDSLTTTCIGLADGVVMVLEAERTRAPVAKQLKRTIEMSGGRVIGAILNHQRYYIPRWVYAIFFKSETKRG